MRKNTRYMTLWHVTHKDNVASILARGIDPEYSAAEIKRVWLVRWYQLAYIFFYLSTLKRIPVWQLVAFKVTIAAKKTTHFNRQIYTSKCVVKATEYMTCDQVLSTMERQRAYRLKYRPAELNKKQDVDLSWLA